LVRTIFGADRKKSGIVKIHGKDVFINSPSDAVKLGMGLLTEERYQGIVPQFSIARNITLPNLSAISNPMKINFKKEEGIAKNFIQMLRISATSIMQRIINLSGGNQQKVILAKWLQSGTKILFLDEPTKGIDVGAKKEILNLILDLTQKGLAVVLVSSELNDLVHICNRVLIMKRGQIIKEVSNVPSDSFLQAEVSA